MKASQTEATESEGLRAAVDQLLNLQTIILSLNSTLFILILQS